MKSVKFRPMRRIKKTGKISVASYMQWRKVMTADYRKFNLIVSDEHKQFPEDEYVYNHNGEQLFFFEYDPAKVPVFTPPFDLDYVHKNHKQYGIMWDVGKHVNYSMRGTDCDGVPTFSHFTAKYISEQFKYESMNDFEPLTVKTVSYWYGWLLWQLNNSVLTTPLIKHI